MKRRTLNTFAGGVAAALMVAGLYGSAAAQDVRIAGNMPLTGPIAAYSGNYFKGFEMGLDDACAAHKVDCGQFKVDPQDNAGDPSQAVSVTQKQLLDDPTVVVSGVTAESIAISPAVDKTEVPHFIVAFDPFLISKGKDRMRVLPNQKVESPLWMRMIDKAKPKRVYALTLNFASTNSQFTEILEPQIAERGIEFAREAFDVSTKDYDTMVLKAKDFNPDLYLVTGFSFNVYPIMKQMQRYGIDPNKVMITLDFIDLLYNGTPKEELKGYYFATSLFDLPGHIAQADEFRDRFTKRYGKSPSYVEAYAYDTAGMIVAAQAKHGEVTKATLTKVTPYDGLTGKIELDEHGDITGTVTLAHVEADGSIVEVK